MRITVLASALLLAACADAPDRDVKACEKWLHATVGNGAQVTGRTIADQPVRWEDYRRMPNAFSKTIFDEMQYGRRTVVLRYSHAGRAEEALACTFSTTRGNVPSTEDLERIVDVKLDSRAIAGTIPSPSAEMVKNGQSCCEL